MIEITNENNMKLMSKYADNYFDLAIVDPPFGIGQNWKKDPRGQHYKHNSTYKNDTIPNQEYFDELFRVSKNQIIWGSNYYSLPATNNLIIWDKKRDCTKTFCSEGEIAWTSIKKYPLRFFRHIWDGGKKGTETGVVKIHPHQKPIKLYEWLLDNYAGEGDKILDTHLGSGSIAIACHNRRFDLTACELNKDYYTAALKRLKQHQKQLTIF